MVLAVLTVLALFAALGGLAQPASAAPSPVVVDVMTEPSQSEQVRLANEVMQSLTPEQRREAIAAAIAARKITAPVHGGGDVTVQVLPAIVYYAVSLILRYGIPWLARWVPLAYATAFNYQNKRATCQLLREQGSWWGYSVYCNGTY